MDRKIKVSRQEKQLAYEYYNDNTWGLRSSPVDITVCMPPYLGTSDLQKWQLRTTGQEFLESCQDHRGLVTTLLRKMPESMRWCYNICGSRPCWPLDWEIHIVRRDQKAGGREYASYVRSLSSMSPLQFKMCMEEFQYRRYRDIIWVTPFARGHVGPEAAVGFKGEIMTWI